jgi:hypothetical protein
VLVVLTHVAEALHLFPWMQWGSSNSAAHYLDLWSAVLGLTMANSEIANSLLLAIRCSPTNDASGDSSLPNPEASPAPARLAGAGVCDPPLGWHPDRC